MLTPRFTKFSDLPGFTLLRLVSGSEVKKQQKKKPRLHGGLSGTSSDESESEESGKDTDDSFKSVSSADEDDDFNPFRDESDEDDEDGELRRRESGTERFPPRLTAFSSHRPVVDPQGTKEKEGEEEEEEEEEEHRPRLHSKCLVSLRAGLHQTRLHGARQPPQHTCHR